MKMEYKNLFKTGIEYGKYALATALAGTILTTSANAGQVGYQGHRFTNRSPITNNQQYAHNMAQLDTSLGRAYLKAGEQLGATASTQALKTKAEKNRKLEDVVNDGAAAVGVIGAAVVTAILIDRLFDKPDCTCIGGECEQSILPGVSGGFSGGVIGR